MALSAQVPLADAASHQHVAMLGELRAATTPAGALTGPRLQLMTGGTLCQWLAHIAEVEIAVAALHDHLSLLDLLPTPIAFALWGWRST